MQSIFDGMQSDLVGIANGLSAANSAASHPHGKTICIVIATIPLFAHRRSAELTLPAFLALLGESTLVREQISGLFVTTAGQKTVNQGRISSLVLPLAPLNEQKRIVAKVDELMRLCDRLEAQQQERKKLLPLLSRVNHIHFVAEPTEARLNTVFHSSYAVSAVDLFKSVLTLAVRGKLVFQEPNDEPASKLLNAIHDKKAELVVKLVIKRSEPSQPPEPIELIHDIPESWAWARLGDDGSLKRRHCESKQPFYWIARTVFL